MSKMEEQKFNLQILYWCTLNVSRMLTDYVEDTSIVMRENAKALA